MPKHNTINYLEFPARDLAATKRFFESCFGWEFTDYGPEYSSFSDEHVDGGFYQCDLVASTKKGTALVIFYSERLDETLSNVKAAGGVVVQEIFSFPGGHRFHFTEPSGNEFSVWSDKYASSES